MPTNCGLVLFRARAIDSIRSERSIPITGPGLTLAATSCATRPVPVANVEDVLALLRFGYLDQPGGDPRLLAAGPAVVHQGRPIEEVDQVVDHLVGGIRIHQRRGSSSTRAMGGLYLTSNAVISDPRGTLIRC